MTMTIFICTGIIILLVISIIRFFTDRRTFKILNSLYLQNNDCTIESQENQDEKKVASDDTTTSEAESNLNNREDANRNALFEIFKEMGCNPSVNEDKHLSVSYQGENFLIMFNGAFIRIWDLSWYSIKNVDDNFTLFKDATNYANFSFGPTIVLHSPDENGNIIFSSRFDIPYVSTMHDGKGYIAALLDSFFALKNSLHKEINRLKEDPQDRTLHDNPIGFDTASLSDPSSPQAN